MGIMVALTAIALPAQVADRAPVVSSHEGLRGIKRICVDRLVGEDSMVAPAREIAIAALFAAKRFTVTEKCEKADAVLKGAVLERGERRTRAEGESANFGVAGGGASANRNSGSAGFGAVVGGSEESLYSSETRSRASVALRLVDQDGDVLWAYTQDSTGGKTKGAIADAVERTVRQLLRAMDRSLP
ncbi:MAG: hypothetical protein ACKV22_19700 [Bryobacteraceae bacterium]